MQRTVVVQETVTHFAPTSSRSAPAMGRKPEPVMVTGIEPLLGPSFGETPVMVVVSSLVPVAMHI